MFYVNARVRVRRLLWYRAIIECVGFAIVKLLCAVCATHRMESIRTFTVCVVEYQWTQALIFHTFHCGLTKVNRERIECSTVRIAEFVECCVESQLSIEQISIFTAAHIRMYSRGENKSAANGHPFGWLCTGFLLAEFPRIWSNNITASKRDCAFIDCSVLNISVAKSENREKKWVFVHGYRVFSDLILWNYICFSTPTTAHDLLCSRDKLHPRQSEFVAKTTVLLSHRHN